MSLRLQWLLLLPALAAPAAAQYGTVSGHVSFSDTKAPARMATVTLELASDLEAYDAKHPAEGWIGLTSVQTSIDGSFVVNRVPPGTYYVFAAAPGYVSPLASVGASESQLRHPDKEVAEKYAKLVPQTLVQANLTSTVELRLERGAAISGRVLYGDGSPALGMVVRALVRSRDNKDKWVPFYSTFLQYQGDIRTDDRGNYRFSGLPAGEYLIEADMQMAVMRNESTTVANFYSGPGPDASSIAVYTGGVFFTKDAKPFSLKLGEERGGEDLDIPLSKLHTVSGVLLAARDGHVLNCCTVALARADDNAIVEQLVMKDGESAFSFTLVPEGDYILSARGQDVQYFDYGKWMQLLHAYSDAKQPLHVSGDTPDVTISMPELPATPSQQ
jgi:hypothetical protein